jgi:hypothetical protein
MGFVVTILLAEGARTLAGRLGRQDALSRLVGQIGGTGFTHVLPGNSLGENGVDLEVLEVHVHKKASDHGAIGFRELRHEEEGLHVGLQHKSTIDNALHGSRELVCLLLDRFRVVETGLKHDLLKLRPSQNCIHLAILSLEVVPELFGITLAPRRSLLIPHNLAADVWRNTIENCTSSMTILDLSCHIGNLIRGCRR